MTENEVKLFSSFLSCSQRYLEFGAGGSTVLAASSSKEWIISVDSSAEWLEKVASAKGAPRNLKLFPALIGRVKEWGYPADETNRKFWPTYSTRVFHETEARDADLVLVDGRFRVACFLRSIQHCPHAIIGIHDYLRPQYHVVESFARKITQVEALAFFIPYRIEGQLRQQFWSAVEKYEYEPG